MTWPDHADLDLSPSLLVPWPDLNLTWPCWPWSAPNPPTHPLTGSVPWPDPADLHLSPALLVPWPDMTWPSWPWSAPTPAGSMTWHDMTLLTLICLHPCWFQDLTWPDPPDLDLSQPLLVPCPDLTLLTLICPHPCWFHALTWPCWPWSVPIPAGSMPWPDPADLDLSPSLLVPCPDLTLLTLICPHPCWFHARTWPCWPWSVPIPAGSMPWPDPADLDLSPSLLVPCPDLTLLTLICPHPCWFHALTWPDPADLDLSPSLMVPCPDLVSCHELETVATLADVATGTRQLPAAQEARVTMPLQECDHLRFGQSGGAQVVFHIFHGPEALQHNTRPLNMLVSQYPSHSHAQITSPFIQSQSRSREVWLLNAIGSQL